MKNKHTHLTVALHGMDARSVKIFTLFLKGPCGNSGSVATHPEEADIDIFDSDAPASKTLLDKHLQLALQKPVMVLSLTGFEHKGILSLTKPVKTDDMLLALDQANKLIGKLSLKHSSKGIAPAPKASLLTPTVIEEEGHEFGKDSLPNDNTVDAAHSLSPSVLMAKSSQSGVKEYQQEEDGIDHEAIKTILYDNYKHEKNAKHLCTLSLDQKSFQAYVRSDGEADVNDPAQFSNAHYNPDNYYLGIVQTAIAACRGKNQAFVLRSKWKPIILLPLNQEVLLGGDEAELKVFAEIRLKHGKKKAQELRLTPMDSTVVDVGRALNKTQRMDTFLWKLACWTSMGRYPQDLDFRKPIYLLHWPNFSRLLVTPHALRIAALLVQGPRTMGSIAEILNIKPQFVFVFVSAAYSIGLVGQAKRISDSLVDALTKKRNVSDVLLLGKIVHKFNDYIPNKVIH
jgi:hypothetical protein